MKSKIEIDCNSVGVTRENASNALRGHIENIFIL